MIDPDYNARFLATADKRIGEVLVEFHDGDIPCRVRHDGSAWIVEENEPDFDGWGCGYHPCDYMIACIIQRQLRKWLDERRISAYAIGKSYRVVATGTGRRLTVTGKWSDISDDDIDFDDYESAQLAGFEVALKEQSRPFCRQCGATIPHRRGEGRCPKCMEHLKEE